jgi:hypothetical protein
MALGLLRGPDLPRSAPKLNQPKNSLPATGHYTGRYRPSVPGRTADGEGARPGLRTISPLNVRSATAAGLGCTGADYMYPFARSTKKRSRAHEPFTIVLPNAKSVASASTPPSGWLLASAECVPTSFGGRVSTRLRFVADSRLTARSTEWMAGRAHIALAVNALSDAERDMYHQLVDASVDPPVPSMVTCYITVADKCGRRANAPSDDEPAESEREGEDDGEEDDDEDDRRSAF